MEAVDEHDARCGLRVPARLQLHDQPAEGSAHVDPRRRHLGGGEETVELVRHPRGVAGARAGRAEAGAGAVVGADRVRRAQQAGARAASSAERRTRGTKALHVAQILACDIRALGDRGASALDWRAGMRSRLGLLITVAVIPLVLWAALPMLSDGSVQSQASSIGSKIDRKKRLIDAKKGRERVLSSTITRYSQRIGSLQGDITVLERKQISIQVDLDAKRAELSRIQEQLRQERIRLARLRARLAEARIALADRLVELYKADKPDVITVVLESDGFADLLERTEFMKRVSDQDSRIIDRVRTAGRRQEDREAPRGAGEAPDQGRQRDPGAPRRGRPRQGPLVDRRDAFARVRSAKSTALASTRDSRQHLEGDLAILEKENARIQARLAAAQNGTGRSPPARSSRAPAGSSGRSTARSCRRSACAGAGCTRASTSRCRRARRCTPPSPAGC